MSTGGIASMAGHAPFAHLQHGPLTRTNTAPVYPTRNGNTNVPPGLTQTMSHASRSSQLSGATAYSSSSTTSLNSMTSSATLVPPPVNGGPVQATNSIINQKADASKSLYQICVSLRSRLALVPGFDTHLSDSDDEDEGEDMDPVSSLWRCLRKGTPLMTIYNSLQPPEPLQMDEAIAARNPKKPAFKFVEACLRDLKLPPGECFTVMDLFGDDTTGFVKVTHVINHVLDEAAQRGLLLQPAQQDVAPAAVAGSKKSYRDHVVGEIISTERKYVQDLENLHDLKKIIEQKGVLPGDVVHDIFLNINAILDFQRRFLIKIETTNNLPEDRQEWGLPFTNYEEAFGIYQPFIANQRKAAEIARKEFDKIETTGHPVALDKNTLDSFLLKPMQRLVKYPLLLKDLRDKTNADDETKADLTAGMEAADRVLRKANEAVDREERNEALLDLCGRVDDWKNHRVDQFGELLLHGHFPVVTGKSDVQKEVRSPSITNSSTSTFSTSGATYVAMGFCDPFGGVLLTSRDTIVTTTGGKSRTASTTSITSSATSRKSGASICSKWDAPKAGLTIVTKEDESLGEQVSIEQQSLRSSVPSSEPPLLFSSKQLSSRQLDNFMNGLRFYQAGGIDRKTGERDIKLAVNYANEEGISCPQFEQYTIYLFERILLCCKEINPNKSKDKIMGTQKDKKDKNKKRGQDKNAKLQLKGRIFMTNVTEVVSFAKLGSYTVQIFWKGDPGVENFIIRFSNEETMNKWYQGVDNQRKQHASSIIGNSPDAPPAEFAWTRDQTAMMPNPYAQADEDDDEDEYPGQQTSPYIDQSGMTRNASNTSLRSRSTTGESQQSLAGIARAPPPRFPMGLTNPPLSLQTTMSSAMPSPGQRVGDSYFSPVAESPASSRTSMASSMFPFPRQGTPQSVWDDPSNRYTAPALARAPSRDSSTPVNNAYQMNGRTPQRPSLPVMASGSQASIAQQRSRSYSTPDIDGQNGYRPRNGPPSGPVPAVPGIPPHLQHPAYDAGIPRSANNSPNGIPVRSSTQSPGAQRERQAAQYSNGSQYNRPPPVTSDSRTMSPPLNSAVSNLSTDSDIGLPTQLKVKVNCDGNYVTLVVAFNIAYQSLIDRIDAKVGRFSNNAIAAGTMRLRYRDEDGDFVTIESDDDIQIAFQEWREAQKLHYHTGQLGEIELFCLSVENNNSQ